MRLNCLELGGVKADGTLDYSKSKRFYFQRKSAWDPAADWRDIAANRAVFRYLQDATSRRLPSAKPARVGAGTFLSKCGQADRNSILTGMWDYLRSGVNTVNQAYVPVGFPPYSFPQGHDTNTAGFNDVAPLVISQLGTRGPAFGIYEPRLPASRADGKSKSPEVLHRFKVLANRASLYAEDQAWRDSPPAPPSPLPGDSWTTREDVYSASAPGT